MKYDVIIVGAGPAGLSTAVECSKNGLNTLIIEKNKEIGYPMKTSAFTWKEVIDKWKLNKESISQKINSIYIKNHHNNEIFEKKYSSNIGCTLNYHNFLKELAKRAVKTGAEIKLNETVKKEIQKGKIKGIQTSKNKYFSKIIIDCSGPVAIVGKKLRPKNFCKAELGIGAEVEMANVILENKKRVEFHVGKEEVIPIGYGWVFPTGESDARIGVATVLNTKEKLKNKKIMKYLGYFVDRKKSPILKTIKRAQPIEMHCGAYHLTMPIKNYADNLMIVGDAASQASAMLGEGIRYALVFGKYAAETALDAINNEDFSEKKLSDYANKCQKYLKEYYQVAQKLLEPSTDEYWTKIVKNLNKYPYLCLPYVKTEITFKQAEKLFE